MKCLVYVLLALLVMFCTSCQKSTQPIENDKPPPGYQEDIPWPSLADSPWPMHHGDPQSTGRSKYPGPMAGTIDWYVDSLYTYSGVSIGADKTIYFVSAGPPLLKGLFAVRPDGSTKWIIEEVASKFSTTTPLVASDGTIYSGGPSLYAINPDGTIKWEYNSQGSIWQAGINIGLDGTVYFVSGWGDGNIIPTLYAVNPDGSLKWMLEYPNLNWSENTGISFSPDGKTLYLPGTGPSLIAIDVENQNIKWTFGESWLPGTVVVDCQGHLYLQSQVDSINSGKASLFSLNPDGSIRWSFAHDNPRFKPNSYAEGTIDKNGNYYFAFDTLYSVDYGGNLRWKLGLDAYSGGPLVCDLNGIVYLPFDATEYLAVSNEGDIIWQMDFDGFVGSSPALGIDQTMYIPTWKSRFVYAIK